MGLRDIYLRDIKVSPGAIRKVLDGDVSALDMCFTWEDSPQGDDYWQQRYFEMEDITKDDRDFLVAALLFAPRRSQQKKKRRK